MVVCCTSRAGWRGWEVPRAGMVADHSSPGPAQQAAAVHNVQAGLSNNYKRCSITLLVKVNGYSSSKPACCKLACGKPACCVKCRCGPATMNGSWSSPGSGAGAARGVPPPPQLV